VTRLRFFTDHCVPTSVIEALEAGSHEVLTLKRHLPTNSNDADVIAKAREIDAILVSLNGDFSDIVNYPPAKFQGIIALQVRNHQRPIVLGGIPYNSNSRIEIGAVSAIVYDERWTESIRTTQSATSWHF
jgi:predicted nuclease of predicted toxin-antitoxin system